MINYLVSELSRHQIAPGCSRIVPILKENGKLRLCIDFRHINNITEKEPYPIPRINDLLDKLAGARTFSIIDATTGYYQLGLEESSKQKTAFIYNNIKYMFNRMPFGLCNAPATFQALMDNLFAGTDRNFGLPYMDDIIIFSKNEKDHMEHLNHVFLKLKGANIYLNKKKCKFFKSEIKILGNIVAHNVVKPDPDKTSAIAKYEKPTTIRELRAFLGLANQTRQYVKEYAKLSVPLCDLLKGQTKRSVRKINWDDASNLAFIRLKKAIMDITQRSQPNFEKEFTLTTDASKDAIGAILSQPDGHGNDRMIYCFSRSMTNAEKNYSVTEKELLAVVKGIAYFRHYLVGKKFILLTDHKALECLTRTSELNSRLMRWALLLQEYDYQVKYIKGDLNIADGLSRQYGVNTVNIKELSKDQKNKILADYHIQTGHGSCQNLLFLLKDKYHECFDQKSIKAFLAKCKTCLKSGGLKINTKNKILDINAVNELWEVDLIGPLKGQEGEYRYILVCIDHYSKWACAALLENKEGKTAAMAINKIIQRNGIPQRILSDSGREFNSREIRALVSKYNFQWSYNSPYHHKTTGLVERTNQTLLRKVRKLANFDMEKWEKYLEKAVLALNISYHKALRTSPYRFRYGKSFAFQTDQEFKTKQIELEKGEMIAERDRKFRKYAEDKIEKGK